MNDVIEIQAYLKEKEKYIGEFLSDNMTEIQKKTGYKVDINLNVRAYGTTGKPESMNFVNFVELTITL